MSELPQDMFKRLYLETRPRFKHRHIPVLGLSMSIKRTIASITRRRCGMSFVLGEQPFINISVDPPPDTDDIKLQQLASQCIIDLCKAIPESVPAHFKLTYVHLGENVLEISSRRSHFESR